MMAKNFAVIATASVLLLAGVAVGGVAALPADLPEQASANASDQAAANDRPVDVGNASEMAAVDVANVSDEAASDPATVGEENGVAQPASARNAMSQQDAGDERPNAAGPPDGLPAQVPDHVAQIHETIESFLDGTVEHLGAQLSELLGTDDDE